MRHLRSAVMFLAVTLVVSALVPNLASAQGKLDHLLCHRMLDKTQISNAVDLFAELQPEFNVRDCVLVKPFEFCVPVTKLNVQPPAPFPNATGQSLKDDYICYIMKCPDKPTVPARYVKDQFGRRLQQKYRPYKLCVPARKAAPPCGPTKSAKQCGGLCPNTTDICRYSKISQSCFCAPQPCGGKPDKAGACGGQCPVAGQICAPGHDASGNVACLCDDPPPPPCGLNPATGTCGGSCPNPADRCVLTATGNDCTCQPIDPGCQQTTPGMCGGTCANSAFQCILDPLTNDCRCEPPPQGCGPNPATGQCGGNCTAPAICRFLPGAGCECQ